MEMGEDPREEAGPGSGPGRDVAVLFERHSREILVHCYRMLGSYSEAEDMLQETSLRAVRSISAFEGRSTVRAWLYRIATNVCLDQLRHRRRRRVLPFDVMAPFGPRNRLQEGVAVGGAVP